MIFILLTDVDKILYKWNSAINNRDSSAMEEVYSECVIYYGNLATKEDIIKDKAKFFKSHPFYKQNVSNVKVKKISDLADGVYRIDFKKAFDNKEIPSYLIVFGDLIVLESDYITDKNLNFEMIDPEFESISFEDKGSKIYRDLKISWKCKEEGDEDIQFTTCNVNLIFRGQNHSLTTYGGYLAISFYDLNGDGYEELLISNPPLHGNWSSIDVIDGKTGKEIYSGSYHSMFSFPLFYRNNKGVFFISSEECKAVKIY